ncbi:MAG: FixH family protein [Actinobacteria bacterium]|nr:FixH family protein [Actinomycetota bacterium]
MRKALFTGVLLAALVHAAPAAAGCWATVQLAPPSAETATGKAWTAKITVLQHGRNPLPDAGDARPTVTIRNAAGGRKTFAAKPIDPSKGLYAAEVVFPSGGTWNYAVFDDFTSANGESFFCARTHELGAVKIAQGPHGTSTSGAGNFPVWALAGAALSIGAVTVLFGRRRGARARRTAVV